MQLCERGARTKRLSIGLAYTQERESDQHVVSRVHVSGKGARRILACSADRISASTDRGPKSRGAEKSKSERDYKVVPMPKACSVRMRGCKLATQGLQSGLGGERVRQ